MKDSGLMEWEQPPLEKLLEIIPSKYQLVLEAGKLADQIKKKQRSNDRRKPLMLALQYIMEGKAQVNLDAIKGIESIMATDIDEEEIVSVYDSDVLDILLDEEEEKAAEKDHPDALEDEEELDLEADEDILSEVELEVEDELELEEEIDDVEVEEEFDIIDDETEEIESDEDEDDKEDLESDPNFHKKF